MEEEKERERDQRDGAGLKRRRKGDDRSRTASSVLTGAVRSVRERKRETQRGREQESGRGDGGEGREKENEWRERCSEQRRRAHRNSRAITHEDRRSLARELACRLRATPYARRRVDDVSSRGALPSRGDGRGRHVASHTCVVEASKRRIPGFDPSFRPVHASFKRVGFFPRSWNVNSRPVVQEPSCSDTFGDFIRYY